MRGGKQKDEGWVCVDALHTQSEGPLFSSRCLRNGGNNRPGDGDFVTRSGEQNNKTDYCVGLLIKDRTYPDDRGLYFLTSPAHDSVGSRPVRTFMSTDFPELEGPKTAVMPPETPQRRQYATVDELVCEIVWAVSVVIRRNALLRVYFGALVQYH